MNDKNCKHQCNYLIVRKICCFYVFRALSLAFENYCTNCNRYFYIFLVKMHLCDVFEPFLSKRN
jgi:hypothetical protein